ncbi:hypothetical protein HT102_10300 [Hoyosella sp. G463]|uniref:Uncharacterized protein n=1 Tax=Lolliginicoccus lacisalsi TaxID=2742202 RepID=A0A927JCU4_9ACTN|nr:hypothetical protein [Lolliginicoccus lacisalsi]MBD8506879.1 hypothetical protein [Lolliginicoccus lacisalsi]
MAPTEDPTTTTTSAPADRLEDLRALSKKDPTEASSQAWAWLKDMRDSELREYDKAAAALESMFRASSPPRKLEGQTEGLLVMTTTMPILDRTVTAVTDLWMPWEGKRFDAEGKGANRIASRASMPLRLLWPLYSMTQTEDGKLAFDFTTHVEASRDKEGGEQDVLVIDYKSVETNPRLLIRSVRDELVELVPGVYLGKILFRVSGRYHKIGFFALHNLD